MSPAAWVALAMQLIPEILKLINDLKDGHYDGDGGAPKLVQKSKELVAQYEDIKQKHAA